MSWDGGSTLAIWVTILSVWFIADLVRSYLDARKRRQCEAAAQAEAELRRMVAERRRMEIEDSYKNIDDKARNRLRTLVEERAKRLDLLIGPGDLEAAVVRMYERSQISRELSRPLGNNPDVK